VTDDATTKEADPDLVVDWTDALDSWELDVDESATAESSPFPAGETAPAPVAQALPSRGAPPPPPPAALSGRPAPTPPAPRPRMYQPPSPEEVARLTQASQKTMPPPSLLSFAEALEAEGPLTGISPAPRELLDAILDEPDSSAPPPRPFEFRQGETLRPFETRAPGEGDGHPTPLVQAPPDEPRLQVLLDDSSEVTLEEIATAVDPSLAPIYARVARLEALARRKSGKGAVELLVSAAELAEQLGENERAEALYQRALAEAPRRASALSALARLAFRSGDTARYMQLLERIAELPEPRSERARTLCTLAIARWLLERDMPAALGAATEAHALAPELLAPALLLARIETATYPTRIESTLLPLVPRTDDVSLAAMWLVAAGRALELRGDRTGARTIYARAAAADPGAFDAQLSLSRMEHALGAHAKSARALLQTLESFDIGPVAEAVRRRAAHMMASEGAHAEAVSLLEHASDDVSLRTVVQIALESGDEALKLKAVESWTLGTDGPERALALLTQAELFAEAGDLERAESTLQIAALADASQALITVAREALARRAGNPARLAEIAAGEETGRGALTAAAKLALSAAAAGDELTWLLEAIEEQSGLAAHALAIDATAELGRADDLRTLLLAGAERGSASARASSLLALAEFERRAGRLRERRDALRRAAELAPDEAAFGRAYARSGPAREEVARSYAHEAELASGARAAFARLREGYAQPDGSPERLAAFAQAYAADPGNSPASWALHREARRQGDLGRLSALHAQQAQHAPDTRGRVAHLVRAALIRSSEDSEAAARELTEALLLTPDDPVLAELVIRLGDAASAGARADALDRMAARVEQPFRRALVLSAAATLEDAGRGSEAALRYRSVLGDAPNDPIASAGLERVVAQALSAPELLDAKLRAASEASTERERAAALEELLLLPVAPALKLEWAHELRALMPAHPLALRAVEHDLMQRDDRAGLCALETQAFEAGRGARDRAARLRFLHVLRALEPEDETALGELDRKVLGAVTEAAQSRWLSRALLSSAIALEQRPLVVRGVELLAQHSSEPVELASLAVQKGWLCLDQAPTDLAGELAGAVAGYPEHPTQLELVAEAKRAAREPEPAAEAFERAAQVAQSSERRAHLWLRAAELWDLPLQQPERAVAAYGRALAEQADLPTARERIDSLLTAQGDVDGLIAHTSATLAREGTPEQLSELERKLADLYERRGERDTARAALRRALSHAPENLPAWLDLARLAERANNHEERAEALLAVARISRDPLEVRDAFLALGELHESALPDRAKAIAAYQRVLKLGPRNTRAFERLAALYRLDGKHDLAAETLMQLARSTSSEIERRDVTIQLASWKEERGDPRAAEELLESLRKLSPTDPVILRALTATLRRNDAHGGLVLHLNRAANDLRHALAYDIALRDGWAALVEVLVERGRRDEASQCALLVQALGLDLPELAQYLPSEPPAGIGAAALSELLDDVVFPEQALPSLRILFRHGADALNRAAPLELRALGADRLDKRHPLRAVVAEQARWVAHRDIEIYTSTELPYAFVPIQDAPIELLVGSRLLDALDVDEQRFLVARALKIARAQMSISCRLAPQELELLLHGLVRSQVPAHTPPFLEVAALDEATRRVGKHVSKRAQGELAPLLLELTYAGVPSFDAASVYGVASSAGSRAGLLATGNVAAALSGLLKLSGLPIDGEPRSTTIVKVDEARELVPFVIGDGYFEARARAGKEAR
jgi:lipopolysaccharide biosynthesis regulator YciM